MTTSNSYQYDPALSDIVIDAFGRIQVRAAELTPDHMISARRALNQILVRWSNRGVNLWVIDEQSIVLSSGEGTYSVLSNTITMLDTFVRLYQLGSPQDITPSFSTTNNSTTVTVNLTDHGALAGYWTSINLPVSVGGIILYGFYQVASVTSTDAYTITAGDTATSTVTNGGAVPVFDTTAQSTTVTVTLANHGYNPGESFQVNILTDVGGLVLQGPYTIDTVPTSSTFTFTALYVAGFTDTQSENDGDAQIAVQVSTAQPVDRILAPMSRTDYASLAVKETEGAPTSFWYDRTIDQTVKVWPVPDANGPYELRFYRMRQIQTANPQGGETADVPYRFTEALVAGLSAQLAMTWQPQLYEQMKAIAEEVWDEAASADVESVRLNMQPDMSTYFN